MVMNSCLFENVKHTERDLSLKEPFKSIVGKTLPTKQVCYMGSLADENTAEKRVIIVMDEKFFYKGDTYQALPIGTELNITKTVEYHREGSRFVHQTVLGSTFNQALDKEVLFEYIWNPELPDNIGADRFEYEVYPLAPWQEQPLPFKYHRSEDSYSPYQWAAKTTNSAFNDLIETITLVEKLEENRNFQNTTFSSSDDVEGKHYFVGEAGTIPRDQLYLLQLDLVHPPFFDTPTKMIIGNDARIHLSKNFITLIITGLFNGDVMISSLVNYDLDGNYIDSVPLSVSNKALRIMRSSNFLKLFVGRKIETTGPDNTIMVHQINEKGEINSSPKTP